VITSKGLCELCGAELDRRFGARPVDARAGATAVGVLDDLAAAVWVQAYDAAWFSRDWPALEKCLAPDVVVMLDGFSTAISGRASVLAHIRAMMSGAHVYEYNATDLTGHTAGTIGVITYRWQLDWSVSHKRRESSGRDVLVLRRIREGWQLVWRAEAPCVVGTDLQASGRSVTLRTVTA
jgi:ketosteroid isomerase-like protein